MINDLTDSRLTKKEFLEYYDRCLVFGLSPCEGVNFKVANTKHISLDISKLEDRVVRIPYFVDSLYREESTFFMKSNHSVEYIDLGRVNTLGKYALCNFDKLIKIRADRLEGIGEGAFRGCIHLEEAEFPKVRQVGHCAFYDCSALERLVLPELLVAKSVWLGTFRNLKYLYAPKLTEFESAIYYYGTTRELEAVFGGNTKIYEQSDLVFKWKDKYIYWYGEEARKKSFGIGYEAGYPIERMLDERFRKRVHYNGAKLYVIGLTGDVD